MDKGNHEGKAICEKSDQKAAQDFREITGAENMNRKNKVIETYGLWFVDLISIVISSTVSTYIRFGNFKDM